MKDTSLQERVKIQASFAVTALKNGGKTTARKITQKQIAFQHQPTAVEATHVDIIFLRKTYKGQLTKLELKLEQLIIHHILQNIIQQSISCFVILRKPAKVLFSVVLMWSKSLSIKLLHQKDSECFRLSKIKFMPRQEKYVKTSRKT